MADNACSVTVVGSRRRVDVTLPGSLPVAEVLVDVMELLAEPELQGVPRWALVRTGGRALDAERGLADQGVTDGSMLFLRDLSRPVAEPAVDDYADAVALAVEARGGRWTAGVRQGTLLVAAAAWVLVAAAFAVQLDAAGRLVASLPCATLLVLAGAVAGRRLGHPGSGAVLALSALPLWAVAGTGAALLAGLSGFPVYLSAAGFLAAGSVAALLAGEHAHAPVAAVLSGIGAPAGVAAVCLWLGATGVQTAAVLATLALVAVRFMPGLAVRVARLGGAPSVSPSALKPGVDAAHSLLAAMLIGASAVVAASSVVLSVNGSWFELGLVAAIALGAAAQVRHFRFAIEAAPLALAALIASGTLELAGVRYLYAEPALRPSALAITVVTALLLAGVGLAGRRRNLSPLLLRRLDQLEALALLAAVPLLAGSLGLYSAVSAAAQRLA